jgi:uncharacterized protein (DUF433 family)
MQLEDFLEFESEPCERIRIRGTRVNLEHVLELYKGGMTPEQIYGYFGQWPPLEKVYAAITYYLANRESVEAYLARGEAAFRAKYHDHLGRPETEAVRRVRAAKAEREAAKARGGS